MTIIDRVSKLIEHLKSSRVILSQAEFSMKIGIQPSQMSEMLKGKRHISERTIRKIKSQFTNINEDWLLIGEGEMLLEDREKAQKAAEGSEDLRKIIALLEDKVEMLAEKAGRLERENNSLRYENESLKKELADVAIVPIANAG